MRITGKGALLGLVAVAMCSLSWSACAADGHSLTATQTYDKFASMSGTERHDALVKAAEAEGELILYTTTPYVEKVVSKFESLYAIDVTVIEPASSEKLRQRLVQQAKAGRVKADILDTLGFDMARVYSPAGLLYPYKSSISQGLPDSAVHGDWITNYYYIFGMGWNTNRIAEGEAPDSLKDLADPKWDGKVGIVTGDSVWYLTLYRYYTSHGMSDSEFVDMFRAIFDGATPSNSHSGTEALLVAGQFAVVPNETQTHLESDQRAGKPVDYTLYEPVIANPNGVGLVKHAQHPAAAVLFMDFYLTKGQQILMSTYQTPVNMAAISEVPDWIPDEYIPIPIDDLEASDYAAWAKAMRNLMQGQGDILP